MSNVVKLSCSCGKVKGELLVIKKSYFHVQCMCCDCQSFSNYLNNKEGNINNILDEHGASDLFQTYPRNMKITEGIEQVSCIQLYNKGLYRWYADCCNTPIANTMSSASVPFVGISVKFMQFNDTQEKVSRLGPITLKAFGKYSIGEMPKDAHEKFPKLFLPKILSFMIKGWFGKKYNPSPFFKNGKAITKVNVLK